MTHLFSKAKEAVVNELHKPIRINFKRRRTIIKGLDDLFQIDLIEMLPYSAQNSSYKYILVVIDSFSKFLWTRPLKSKSAKDVTDAMNHILKNLKGTHHSYPTNLQSDLGKEFYNKTFQDLMKKYNINHYSSYTKIKASMAERVIRTLKAKLYKLFSLRGTYKWINILQDVTKEYNNSKHRTIDMAPNKVTRKNEKLILRTR
jgi:transposase InsO family protein